MRGPGRPARSDKGKKKVPRDLNVLLPSLAAAAKSEQVHDELEFAVNVDEKEIQFPRYLFNNLFIYFYY